MISFERVAAGPTKIAKNPQILTVEHHFVLKGCRGSAKTAIKREGERDRWREREREDVSM